MFMRPKESTISNNYVGIQDKNINLYLNLVRFYILKILVDLKKYKKLIENEDYEILEFLGIKNYSNDNLFNLLKEKFKEVKKCDFTKLKFFKNIEKLSNIMELNEIEKKFLIFALLLEFEPLLENVFEYFGYKLNTLQKKIIFSQILDVDFKEIDRNNLFFKAYFDNTRFPTSNKLKDIFYDNVINKLIFNDIDVFEILENSVRPLKNPNLTIEDYKYLEKDINHIINFFSKEKKANILLYGHPGTGKTELAKIIAQILNKKIYEISYLDENNEPIEVSKRLINYSFAQQIFKNTNTILLYDEAEDIFSSDLQKEHKAWINRSLEENSVPTIWISNDIRLTDKAILRRFDYILHMPIPSKKVRKSIIKKYANVSKKTLKLLSSHKYLSPAIIDRAVKVWKKTSNEEKELIRIINNILVAQGYEKISKKKKKQKISYNLPNFYNIDFINTNLNIKNLIKGLEETQIANICIYGISGTGKSAFAKYIASKLNKKFILKKASDLLSPYVGETEHNIANAFKTAKEKKAVLIFDEVDTFLRDRNSAIRNWEISQVNEMLLQMEEFDGIFIATTNLMDNIDEASLRRFDIKMEFKPLKEHQIKQLTISILKELNIKPDIKFLNKITKLKNLTFGDFNTLVKQHKLNKIVSTEDFYNRLIEELKIKKLEDKSIGF